MREIHHFWKTFWRRRSGRLPGWAARLRWDFRFLELAFFKPRRASKGVGDWSDILGGGSLDSLWSKRGGLAEGTFFSTEVFRPRPKGVCPHPTYRIFTQK